MFRNRYEPTTCVIALLSLAAACAVTPEPLPQQAHVARSNADLEALRSTEFVPTKPITLHEAMARAVAFNLKRHVSQIERNIAEAELEQSNYDMLPALELNANKNRNDVEISASDDRIAKSADASFTWNLLDLGVSYARANQRADEVLIAKERERKALQDILRQVNTAYWRAATGQRLMTRVRSLAKDLQLAMKASHRMEKTRATDIISAVSFRRDIVESVRQALSMQRELHEAKAELAELLNIRPGTDFELAVPEKGMPGLGLPMSVAKMEQHALLNRPELRIEEYNERVSEWEAREALYNMLPGLDLSVGRNYSSETTNLSPNWISTGLHLGMNLFNLFSGSSQIETAERKGELARQQRLAMSLAVLTQLHIAHVKYRHAEQQMRLVKEIADSDRHLSRLVGTRGKFLNKDFFDSVRLATRQLNSELDEQRTFVELVSSHAEVMHAIGYDAFPDTIPLNDIAALTTAIRQMTAKWERVDGDVDIAAETPMDRLVNALLPGEKPVDPAQARIAAASAGQRSSESLTVKSHARSSSGDALKGPVRSTSAAVKKPGDGLPEDTWLDEENAPFPDPAVPSSAGATGQVTATATDDRMAPKTAMAEDVRATIPDRIIERLNRVVPASGGDATARTHPIRDWELTLAPRFRSGVRPFLKRGVGAAPDPATYIVTLGAFRKQDNAFKLHRKLVTKPRHDAGGTELAVVLRPSENGTTYYFVQTNPVPDRASAVTLCRKFKRSGRACHVSVVRN